MWKASIGHQIKVQQKDDDDFETDPDFEVNFGVKMSTIFGNDNNNL